MYKVYLFFVLKLRDTHTHTQKHLKGKTNLSLQAGPRLMSPYSCRDFLFRGGRDGSQASRLRAGWHSVSSYVIVAIYSFALDLALPCLIPSPCSTKYSRGCLASAEVEEGFAPPAASGPSWFQHRQRNCGNASSPLAGAWLAEALSLEWLMTRG